MRHPILEVSVATREFRAGLAILSLFIGTSCASGGSPSSGATGATAVQVPARMLNTGPVMRLPGRFSGTIELPIDINGRPEVLRMKVMGRMTEDVRRAFIEYYQSSTFAPATINGLPVPSVLKIRFQMR